MATADARWTLEELNDLAIAVLAEDRSEAGRWQGVELGPRTIRYYATLGLVDRPSAMRGRKAFYGERHLLQLVAIKRLQAQGLSLEAVQVRLSGMPTQTLREIARIPDGFIDARPDVDIPSRDDEEFWVPSLPEPSAAPEPPPRLVSVQVDPAVIINIATRHPLQASDVDAVHEAAQELVRKLWERGLIAVPVSKEPS